MLPMNQPFLEKDALSSLEEIKNTFLDLGVSPFHISTFFRKLGLFFTSRLENLTEEQTSFISNFDKYKCNDVPSATFEEEIKTANWFLPKDSYIRLSIHLACVADYLIASSANYCERMSKQIVIETKETFLLPMQKENKGLALIYLASH